MDLSTLRSKIDEIDAGIVALYEKRMDISKQVAEYKIESGKNVLDKAREEDKIRKVKELTHNDFNAHGIEELYEQIMSMSRKLQYQMLSSKGAGRRLPFQPLTSLDGETARVVYQGENGAYSKIAMERYFGKEVDHFHVDTFREAMLSIEEGNADYAVLPIENSSAGIVSEIYDLLVDFENYIVGEIVIPIEHCLLGIPGCSEETVKTVFSHPQSLMQSAGYLNAHPSWKQVGMQNNAFAARKAAEDGDITQAAIAGESAGEIYGLQVIRKGVQDNRNNSTRFIIITGRKVFLENAKKVSICFEIPHQSGSLYRILSHFIYNNLNMNKIESRPIGERNWEYRFFIDFDGNLTDSAVKNALFGLREEVSNMKILGNY